MLYIGYLMLVNGRNMKKSEISIFELQREENCMSRLCPASARSNHKNRMKNT